MMPRLAAIVIMLHSALVMSVKFTVFIVFTAVIAMLFTLVVEILHPIHVELEFEQIQLDFHSRLDSMSRRHCIRR